VVLDLILEAKARGAALVGIFHDAEIRDRVCDRAVDVTAFSPGHAA
jgi:alpha-D-ribose 1-methylphosphonate 5-triphosphate synthase subunit PhnL